MSDEIKFDGEHGYMTCHDSHEIVVARMGWVSMSKGNSHTTIFTPLEGKRVEVYGSSILVDGKEIFKLHPKITETQSKIVKAAISAVEKAAIDAVEQACKQIALEELHKELHKHEAD